MQGGDGIAANDGCRSQLNRPHAVHAILTVGKRYVLQLRDNKPDISAPGMWSLFGGLLEEGEAPSEALVREIHEELMIELVDYRHLWSFERWSHYFEKLVDFTFFASDISELWKSCNLMEGQAIEQFDYQDLCGLDMPDIPREVLDRHHREFGHLS